MNYIYSASFVNLKDIRRKNLDSKENILGVPVVAQWLTNLTRNHEIAGWIPGLSELGIQHCRELWCSLQTRLGSQVAVAVA